MGQMIDRAVLAERRALRAERSEHDSARRAAEAEALAAALRADIADLEVQLNRAAGERLDAEARLAERDRMLRAAAQRAHAEQRLREEAGARAIRSLRTAESEACALRERLQRAEREAAELRRRNDQLARRAAEAEHALAAAAAAERQAETAQTTGLIAAAGRALVEVERTIREARDAAATMAAETERSAPDTTDGGSPAAERAPGRRRPGPWLTRALPALAAQDPEAAARLALALVPVQAALARTGLDYDLRAGPAGWHRVTRRDDGVEVVALRGPRRRGEVDFRVLAQPRELAELLARGGRGRWGIRPRVRATLRRRRARAALPPVRLRLDELAARGVPVPPALALQALVALLDPAWTTGHAFCVAAEVAEPEGPAGSRYVLIRDGEPPLVRERAPEDVHARVRASPDGWAALLSGIAPKPEDRPTVRGDAHAVRLLERWTRLAQEAG